MSVNELEPTGTGPWPTWPGTHEPDLAPRGQTEPDNIAPTAGESWPLLTEPDLPSTAASGESWPLPSEATSDPGPSDGEPGDRVKLAEEAVEPEVPDDWAEPRPADALTSGQEPWPVLAEQSSRPHEILPGIVADERPRGIALTRPRTSKATADLNPPDSDEISMAVLIIAISAPGVGGGILVPSTEALLKELFAPWLQFVLAFCFVAAIFMAALALFWVLEGLRAAVDRWLYVTGGRWLCRHRPALGTELLFPALPVRLGEPTHVQFQQQRALGNLRSGPYASIRCEEWTKTSSSTKVLWTDGWLDRDFDAPDSDAEFIRGAWRLELPPDMPPSLDTPDHAIRWILTVWFVIKGNWGGRVDYKYEFVISVIADEKSAGPVVISDDRAPEPRQLPQRQRAKKRTPNRSQRAKKWRNRGHQVRKSRT